MNKPLSITPIKYSAGEVGAGALDRQYIMLPPYYIALCLLTSAPVAHRWRTSSSSPRMLPAGHR